MARGVDEQPSLQEKKNSARTVNGEDNKRVVDDLLPCYLELQIIDRASNEIWHKKSEAERDEDTTDSAEHLPAVRREVTCKSSEFVHVCTTKFSLSVSCKLEFAGS